MDVTVHTRDRRVVIHVHDVFEKAYPYKKTSARQYQFKSDGGNTYVTSFHHGVKSKEDPTPTAHVQFTSNSSKGFHHEGLTGTEPHAAHKVIGTVNHIVGEHLKNNPKVGGIHFIAEEPSRQKLYGAMVKKMASHHTVLNHGDGAKTFVVRREHLK